MIQVPKARLATAGPQFRVSAPEPSGLEQVGNQALALGTKIKAQEETEQLANLDLQAAKRLQETRLSFEQDTNYSDMAARQAQAHGEIEKELTDGLPAHLQETFRRRFQSSALGHEAAITRRSSTLRTNEGRARLGRNMDEYLQLASDAPDDASRDSANLMVMNALTDAQSAGYYTPEEAEAIARGYASKLQKVQATRLYTENPAVLAEKIEAGEFAALDPLETEQFRVRALDAVERRADREAREIKNELALIEAARANGTEADNEGEVVARAAAAGMFDTASRAVQRGKLLSTIPDMSRDGRLSLLEDLRKGGVSDPKDVKLIEALTDLERDAIAAERKAAEKAGERQRTLIEKQTAAERKAAAKVIDNHIKAMSGDKPFVLDGVDQARTMAHALGRGDEFEKHLEIYSLRQSVPGGDPSGVAGALANQGLPTDLATGRAQMRLADEIEAVSAEIDKDVIAYAAKSGRYGQINPDFSSPQSLINFAELAEQANADLRRPQNANKPVQYFSEEHREWFRDQWDNADGDTRAGLIRNFAQMPDDGRAKAMINQLGIDDPGQRVAALRLAKTGDERVFLQSFRGQEALDAGTVTPPSASIINSVIYDTLGPALGPNVAQQAGVVKLAKSLYAAEAAGINPENPTDQEEAFEAALKTALGGEVITINDNKTLLPIDITEDDANRALRRLQLTILPGASDEEKQAQLAQYGTGGVPSIGGQPIDGVRLSQAAMYPVGDGLYTLEYSTANDIPAPVMRSDKPDERWIFDMRKTANAPR